mmetsp:Transcript_35368/g.90498  ORF Transcript_35368/g.90498 Transcript_35368/m.90498 type:complete len:492 (+) Transcript_35368:147-1622(+)|eukprot:jgi/Tetstr1/423761/TSEL_014391.t1
MGSSSRRLLAAVLLSVLSTLLAVQPASGQDAGATSCRCPAGFTAECAPASNVNLSVARVQSVGCRCLPPANGQQQAQPCLDDSADGAAGEEDAAPDTAAAEEDCTCTREFIPQCDASGDKKANNECIRDCLGFSQEDVNFLNCGMVTPEEYLAEFEDELEAPVLDPVTDEEAQPGEETRGTDGDEPAGVPGAVGRCEDGCDLSVEWVCDSRGSRLAPSGCAAQCLGYRPEEFSAANCAPGYRDNVLCGCTPQESDVPVCNAQARKMAPSSCVAECLGYAAPDFTAENCDASPPLSICGFNYVPYCDEKGTAWASNLCEAQDLYSEETVAALREEACAPMVRENAACGCAGEVYAPVCDSRWSEIAPNACVAACAGYEEWTRCDDQLLPFAAPGEEGARNDSRGNSGDGNDSGDSNGDTNGDSNGNGNRNISPLPPPPGGRDVSEIGGGDEGTPPVAPPAASPPNADSGAGMPGQVMLHAVLGVLALVALLL